VTTSIAVTEVRFRMRVRIRTEPAGGLVLRGDLSGRPLSNTAVLLTGGVLASFIGTTGESPVIASMPVGRSLVIHTRIQAKPRVGQKVLVIT